MDRQLLERLIGAGVLVLLLVIIVPSILDGDPEDKPGSEADRKSAAPGAVKEPRRIHTIRPDQSTERPPVAQDVSEPAKLPAVPAEPKPASKVESKPVAKATPKAPAPPPAKRKPVESAPVKPAPVKATPVPTEGWVVQLGSFSSKQNAQRLTDEVSARGFPAFLMSLQRSGKKLYRVRVGPRKTREQATDLAGRLAKVGYTGQVTRQQPDT